MLPSQGLLKEDPPLGSKNLTKVTSALTAGPRASQPRQRSRHRGAYPPSQSPAGPDNSWSALHPAQSLSKQRAIIVPCDFAAYPGSFAALAARKVLAAPGTPG